MTLGVDNSILYSDLIGHTRKITKTDSTKFLVADIKALLNLYYHEFVNEILKSGSDIDFNLETGLINLVADTATYSITGKVLRIKRVEVQWESGGAWYPVEIRNIVGESSDPLDTTSIGQDYSKSKPYGHLYTVDETLKLDLYPIPSANMTSGLKVWKVLEITELSGTSDEPSIPEAYQKYLCYGSARDYFIEKEMFKKVAEMEKRMFIILNRAISFYASRNENQSYKLESGMPDDYGE